MRNPKIIVVLPAYNAEATLEKTISDIPLEYVDELVFVDDASRDKSVELAREIAANHPQFTASSQEYAEHKEKKLFTILQHDKNKGYGGNQKSCYDIALSHGADIVVMLHPDYQYDPKLVKYFVEFIQNGYFDVMLGSRIRTRKEALAGGMPPYKYYANRLLSFMQNIVSGRSLSEWHTGMRAYTSEVLRSIPYERFSDDFIFDTQALFAIAERGYSIGDIPVPVRYFKEASSINFSRSVRYGLLTVWETVKFSVRNSQRIIRYSIAGLIAVATNLVLYTYLLYVVHLWYTTAAFIAFCGGAVTSFLLQKYWTFGKESLEKIYREIASYALLVICNSFANAGILFLFVRELMFGKLVGNVLSNCIVALWSFFIYKYVTFRDSKLGTESVLASDTKPNWA